MANVLETNQKILNGLLYFNIIFLLISFFHISLSFVIGFQLINIILISTHLIIKKNYLLIQGISTTNKLFKHLNKMGSSE